MNALARVAAVALVVLILYWLYQRGQQGRPRRRAVFRGDDSWTPMQTSLRGEETLMPLAAYLREQRVKVQVVTEPGPGGRELGKLLVQRKDLARARELAARFEMQTESVLH